MPSDRAIQAVIDLRTRYHQRLVETGLGDPAGTVLDVVIAEMLDEHVAGAIAAERRRCAAWARTWDASGLGRPRRMIEAIENGDNL